MSTETKAALERLIGRYLESCRRSGASLPVQEYDPRWPSACQVGEPDASGMIRWKPQPRDRVADFSGLERALDVAIHADIKAFYGSYWGSPMELEAQEGGVTLIQIWNEEDFERLIENILGHALAKQRIGAALTIFIACTDEGELMLSVENDTGHVVLEEPGRPPIRQVAASLAELLERLDPVASPGR